MGRTVEGGIMGERRGNGPRWGKWVGWTSLGRNKAVRSWLRIGAKRGGEYDGLSQY